MNDLMEKKIFEKLFNDFSEVCYLAIYCYGKLVLKQKENSVNNSIEETDKYEEILASPAL